MPIEALPIIQEQFCGGFPSWREKKRFFFFRSLSSPGLLSRFGGQNRSNSKYFVPPKKNAAQRGLSANLADTFSAFDDTFTPASWGDGQLNSSCHNSSRFRRARLPWKPMILPPIPRFVLLKSGVHATIGNPWYQIMQITSGRCHYLRKIERELNMPPVETRP